MSLSRLTVVIDYRDDSARRPDYYSRIESRAKDFHNG